MSRPTMDELREREPRWYVVLDEDGDIMAGGTRWEMEAFLVDQEEALRDEGNPAPGLTLHGIYMGPAVEVRNRG